MMTEQSSIGIDLGTSNSVIGVYAEGAESRSAVVSIPQLVTATAVAEREVLPSALYIPYADEFSNATVSMPWSADERLEEVIGMLARERAQLTPERVITSAKSWLCNTHVDRKADILPWKAEGVERKYSPFEATRRYLLHLHQSLRLQLERRGERWYDDSGLPREIVLTVPASFDEVARQLTLEAAQSAGFERVVLLEEPQAAFYAWIARCTPPPASAEHRSPELVQDWRKQVSAGDVVLVCDVGGGTADFTLIAIGEASGDLSLERVSVGDHILLGGDNMDLALAFSIRQELEAAGQKLDAWQFRSLVHAARDAKERLLGDQEAPDSIRVGIASRSSNLFAESLSALITKDQAKQAIVEGFFPLVEADARPRAKAATGLQEIGLRYAHDAAVTRHLAKFLSDSYQALSAEREHEGMDSSLSHERRMVLPTAVLFNGGVFKSTAIRSRVLDQLRAWCGGTEVRELRGEDLDVAVAVGAAYYANIRQRGRGLKIRSGLSHAYYLGLESSELAIPGYEPPLKGVCVAAQGMEEGTSVELPEQQFGLLTNQPVQFRLFSSPRRALDVPGTVVDDVASFAEESAVVETTLHIEGQSPR